MRSAMTSISLMRWRCFRRRKGSISESSDANAPRKTFFGAVQAREERSSPPFASLYVEALSQAQDRGIRWCRWIRDGEHDEITPPLHKTVE